MQKGTDCTGDLAVALASPKAGSTILLAVTFVLGTLQNLYCIKQHAFCSCLLLAHACFRKGWSAVEIAAPCKWNAACASADIQFMLQKAASLKLVTACVSALPCMADFVTVMHRCVYVELASLAPLQIHCKLLVNCRN